MNKTVVYSSLQTCFAILKWTMIKNEFKLRYTHTEKNSFSLDFIEWIPDYENIVL